jgi:integrase
MDAGSRPAPANEIAARAGHTSVKTVLDVYGHPMPATDERLLERLEELFPRQPRLRRWPDTGLSRRAI